jgi:tetratricopeptide (TPR) repeat protein
MALDIFISYAHKDKRFCDDLKTHLSSLRRQKIINDWYDGDINPGTEWEPQIHEHLDTAQIILLLISADFMASDFCYSVELQRAIERHDAGQARVIPIILRPVDWKDAPFAKIQALPTYGKPISKWTSRDEAFNDVVQGIKNAIQDLPKSVKPSDSLPPTASTTAGGEEQAQSSPWNIPFHRNSFFTGREEILTRLRHELQEGHTAALSQPVAVSGMGGIGKTQTAVEYAYRYRDDYQAVLWLKSSTPEELTEDFAGLAQLLQLPEREVQEQARVIAAVKRWLEMHTRWLLIFDNADDLPIVRDYIPSKCSGHILLTTRAHAMSGIATKIEIPEMNDEEGIRLLLQRAGLIKHATLLEQVAKSDLQEAQKIVEELGRLPLALDQAGAYIEETGESLASYLQLYQDQREELLQWRSAIADHVPVATTWTMALQNIEEDHPTAIELIRFCAFLAPDMIPEELLPKAVIKFDIKLEAKNKQTLFDKDPLGKTVAQFDATLKSLDIRLQAKNNQSLFNKDFLGKAVPNFDVPLQVKKTQSSLNKDIADLLKYSLIQRDNTSKTITIHRLVQVVIRDSISKAQKKRWAEQVVQVLGTTFPFDEVAPWTESQKYLSHALQVAEYINQWSFTFAQARNLLNKLGTYFMSRGQYKEAESFKKQHLIIIEKNVGLEHTETATSLNNLGNLYAQQHKYQQAEALYQRALSICEKHLGSDHPDIALCLSNLGSLYIQQDKYQEAELLYQRVLIIREKHLGSDHPDTAHSLNNLGNLYTQQGKYQEAGPLLQRALAILEMQLELDHPDIALCLNNLSNLYTQQGKYQEAELLCQQALAIYEKRLGSDHPDTAHSLSNLGYLYNEQGKYQQAEPLLQRAIAIREQRLGGDHPYTASSINNLGYLYTQQDKYQQAEPLFQQALAIFEKRLGPDHPKTADCLIFFSTYYEKQGNYAQAEALLQRALTIREKRLGVDHPKTIKAREQYAELERRMKGEQVREDE